MEVSDGLAALHSGHGRAVTEVSDNAVELVACNAEHVSCNVGDVLVAGAVEAVAADAVLVSQVVGDCVAPCFFGHGGVERGVEDSEPAAGRATCALLRAYPERVRGCAAVPAGRGRRSAGQLPRSAGWGG